MYEDKMRFGLKKKKVGFSVSPERHIDNAEDIRALQFKSNNTILEAVLIGNKSKQIQWEISHVQVGEKIKIEEESDNKYIVTTKDHYDLGYLPQTVGKKVKEFTEAAYETDGRVIDIIGEVTEIINEYGKLNAKICLVLEDNNLS